MATEVKASHILVATEDEAKSLYNEIKNGKDFAGCDAVFGILRNGGFA